EESALGHGTPNPGAGGLARLGQCREIDMRTEIGFARIFERVHGPVPAQRRQGRPGLARKVPVIDEQRGAGRIGEALRDGGGPGGSCATSSANSGSAAASRRCCSARNTGLASTK